MTREIAAEAAVWIARLHGPCRSTQMERECRAWQARSPIHRLAFERCTDLWMDAAGVDRAAVARVAAASSAEDRQRGGRGAGPANDRPKGWHGPRLWVLALTVAAMAFAAGVVHQLWRGGDSYETGIGEQRLVVLKDGTRMTLNTSTRVSVELGQAQRRVSVEGGEAFFEVAKDTARPFIVRAAGTEVTATGTAFMVRLAPTGAGELHSLDVALVEGQVVVVQGGSKSASAFVQPIVMAAGDRLRVDGELSQKDDPLRATAAPQRDRPRLDQLLAWKRGEAIFDNVSLPEALAEMNRYSRTEIVADAGLQELRVSGVYKTGDSAGFASALASLHGLAVQEGAGRLRLVYK